MAFFLPCDSMNMKHSFIITGTNNILCLLCSCTCINMLLLLIYMANSIVEQQSKGVIGDYVLNL